MLYHNSVHTCIFTTPHCTPTSAPYPAFYTADPHLAHTYAHTYAHTAKRCLDPPRPTMFGSQRREGVVQFAHALHTATSTRTPTKNICGASYTYRIPHYTCVLYIRRPMHMHASMPVYNKLHNFHCESAQSFIAIVREVSLRAYSSICFMKLRCKRT